MCMLWHYVAFMVLLVPKHSGGHWQHGCTAAWRRRVWVPLKWHNQFWQSLEKVLESKFGINIQWCKPKFKMCCKYSTAIAECWIRESIHSDCCNLYFCRSKHKGAMTIFFYKTSFGVQWHIIVPSQFLLLLWALTSFESCFYSVCGLGRPFQMNNMIIINFYSAFEIPMTKQMAIPVHILKYKTGLHYMCVRVYIYICNQYSFKHTMTRNQCIFLGQHKQ